MANRPSRLAVSIPTASPDGRFYGRYPHGNAPSGVFSGGAAASAAAAGALSTGIKLAGAPAVSSAATAALTASGSFTTLQSSDLTYLGAFGVPQSGVSPAISSGLTYNPAGHSGAGSLFASGGGFLYEITIPSGLSPTYSDINSLPVCTVLQSDESNYYAGATLTANSDGDNSFGHVAYVSARGGWPAYLYWSIYQYYNVNGVDYDSVGIGSLNLSSPAITGAWHVGPPASTVDPGSPFQAWSHGQKHGSYFVIADQTWADTFTGGRSVLCGRIREAGADGGSQGPVLTAIAPWQDSSGSIPAAGANLGATPLMYFDCQQGSPLNGWQSWRCYNDPLWTYFSAKDIVHGGVWIQGASKRALVLAANHSCFSNNPTQPKYQTDGSLNPTGPDGSHGGFIDDPSTAPFCYGVGGTECATPIANTNDKGYHCGPYVPRLWFVDIAHLEAVATGSANALDTGSAYESFDVSTTWPLGLLDTDNQNDVPGIAWDAAGKRLFVVQANAQRPGGGHNQPYPVVHVYSVDV